jgi:hypothetical protein
MRSTLADAALASRSVTIFLLVELELLHRDLLLWYAWTDVPFFSWLTLRS